MLTIEPRGSNFGSAATRLPPLVKTEYPLAVMPSALAPQLCASGLYAVTFMRIVRAMRMGRPLNVEVDADSRIEALVGSAFASLRVDVAASLWVLRAGLAEF